MAFPNWFRAPNYVTLQCSSKTPEDFPGRRCGHTLTALKGCLILFGGSTAVENDGSSLPRISPSGVTNSVHRFDINTRTWTRVYPAGEPPSPRACHAAALFGPNMVAVQGGIGSDGLCQGDLYVLEITIYNDFRWQRLVVDGETPSPRYGHTMGLAADRRLVIYGGKNENIILADTWALNTSRRPVVWERLYPYGHGPIPRIGGRDFFGVPQGNAFGLEMLSNGSWLWSPVPGVAASQRYPPSAVFVDPRVPVVGGVGSVNRIVHADAASAVLNTTNDQWLSGNPQNIVRRCCHAATSFGGFVYVYGGIREGELLDDLLVSNNGIIVGPQPLPNPQPPVGYVMRRISSESSLDRLAQAPHANLQAAFTQAQQPNVVNANEGNVNRGGLARQLSLDRYEDERQRTSLMRYSCMPPFTKQFSIKELVQKVISTLLKPQGWEPPASRDFFLSYYEMAELCSAAKQIFIKEQTVLTLDAPVKVFGDLHGQFGDLMRLFKEYGSPSMEGDISYIDYLFLGDYVDRGKHSLETIMLLLALKIEYPKSIHMIRGNHESCSTNIIYGFKAECMERIGEKNGLEAFLLINELFNHLPLAALIEKKIFCVHGGIGSTIFWVEQVASILRPVYTDCAMESKVVKDLLWSDPTENDSILGIRENARGPAVVSFGPDIVEAFCERNHLDMIIRAHECVMDGFERFADGKLITVFSATNYCGTVKNAGAILVIGRDLLVVPKLIHPLPPPISPSEEDSSNKAWMEPDSERPPSPARGQPKTDFEIGSSSST